MDGEELATLRRRLERAWASYIHDQARPEAPHEIVSSWQRSRRAVSPLRAAAPVDDPDETLREWRDSLLYAAAKPLLAEMQRAADDQDLIVGVADASGKLLWTHSSRHMQRRAEGLHFVPGGHWDERSVGTNALALALRTAKPARVFSAEHFLQAVHDWVCYSAPIRDPRTGTAIGVLDFSTTWQKANGLGLVTATALARYIEARLEGYGYSEVFGPSTPPTPAPLQLKLCGEGAAYLGDRRLELTPRRLEILAILALCPQGLSLDALHAHLYGDQTVSLNTLKAEVSGLRKQLGGGVASRPYRLTTPCTVDALEVERRLQAGDVAGALAHYGGLLLCTSESPFLSEWRDYLANALQAAVASSDDPELMWRYTLRGAQAPGDFEVLLRLTHLLEARDPRLALVKARLKLLLSEAGHP
jgi:hypothetical protein